MVECTRFINALVALGLLAGCYDGGRSEFVFPPRDGECVDLAGVSCAGTSTDADRTVPLPETTPDTTYVYVVSSLTIPEADPDPDGDGPERGSAAGFNLDGLDSGDGSTDIAADCQELNPDFGSATDPDHRGVDNAFQGLVGTIESFLDPSTCPSMSTDGCLDSTIRRQISEGSWLLLMEVSRVNDLTYDSSVSLQLHLGATADGRPPATESDGTLSPGQVFVGTMPLGDAVEGDIFEGRLAARPMSLPVSILTPDSPPVLLPITQTQVRFDISALALRRGAVGGLLRADDLGSPTGPGIYNPIGTSFHTMADMHPLAADPARCDAMSIGLLFEATAATLN